MTSKPTLTLVYNKAEPVPELIRRDWIDHTSMMEIKAKSFYEAVPQIDIGAILVSRFYKSSKNGKVYRIVERTTESNPRERECSYDLFNRD